MKWNKKGSNESNKGKLARTTAMVGAVAAAVTGISGTAVAQNNSADDEAIVVTGTRIRVPGVESSSPIYSVGAEEIQLQQQPEVERIIRILPISMADDGQNVNNGTAGAATVNLRGLGAQRNMIMIDGQRITPYDINGLVDTQVIPTALIDRIDIITGGASAVYGSDAMSGAINFIMKRDFEGIEVDYDRSITGDSDGEINTGSITMGANIADGRGNVVLTLNHTDRDGVQLGQRPLGRLGITTAAGGNYANFLAGVVPTAPADPNCQGENAVATGGSGTTLPTRITIAGGVTDPTIQQFRTDGTIGANCSVFNFNPYNYYQTPQERFGATALATYEINNHAEAYARFTYGSTNVRQQIAPSGIFGTPFWTPLSNPLIAASARAAIIAEANDQRLNGGTVSTGGAFPNWRDLNNNGVVDAPDDLNIAYFRRTVELGPRSTTFDQSVFQILVGLRGELVEGWDYDVSFSHGESDRTQTDQGYTNVSNVAQQVNSVDGVTCRGTNDPACVPINLFGGVITPAMGAYAGATALEQRLYEQTIFTAVISGSVDQIRSPWASSAAAVSMGFEYREEEGSTIPDECKKLAPASCLGGAGGNTLPISGGFDAHEYFAEAIIPLVNDMPFAQSLDLELGYRYSEFRPSGVLRTYKYGISWEPIDGLRLRAMQQRAARAPNVGELAAPQTTGLDNATTDPCSTATPVPQRTAALRALCESTGMSPAQVWAVGDIIAGQINAFFGTDLTNLPDPETADTTTLGVVFTPDLSSVSGIIRNPVITVDYYDIKIDDYIGTFTAQEVLDGCYVAALVDQCAKIVRVGGNLLLPGSGVQEFTTNLEYLQAEGIEIGASFGLDLGAWGGLNFTWNANHYITKEFQSSLTTPVQDCVGAFGPSCLGPLPETRWVQRTTWDIGDFQFSYLWRHFGEATSEVTIFPAFQTIDAYDWFDLAASWQVTDNARLSASVVNVTDEQPPVVGNEAADTGSNSGNTFPSQYDTLGRVFSVGFNLRF